MEDGSVCIAPHVGITTETECMKAAGHLNLRYEKVGTSSHGEGDFFPGCFFDANDGRNKVYFNKSTKPNRDAKTVNKKYAGICKYKVTVTGKRCVLPFTYKSETFTDCVPSASWPSSSWCSTSNDSDGHYDDWDYCATGSGQSFASAPNFSYGCLILFSLFA